MFVKCYHFQAPWHLILLLFNGSLVSFVSRFPFALHRLSTSVKILFFDYKFVL